jgi:hypothetical protein
MWLESADDGPHVVSDNMVAIGVLAALLFPIASIRWYVAGVMMGATVLAWIPALVVSRRRLLRAGMVATFVLVTALLIPVSAGPYLPPFAQQLFRPTNSTEVMAFPARAAEYVEEKRADSLATEADTIIRRPGTPQTDESVSIVERMFPRAIAMFVPRFIGSAFGWIAIGGGRGLWVLAELDTLFFDVLLIALAWRVWHEHLRGLGPRPTFVLVAITTAVLAAAICYQTANFGTQFRLRSMVAIGFLLVPLSLGHRAEQTETTRRTAAVLATAFDSSQGRSRSSR